jgi:hypothetical protein
VCNRPQVVTPPGPIQLVNGAVAMLSKSPATAFALSDLLTATCRQKGGENCKFVLQRLVEYLRTAPPGTKPRIAGRSEAAIQAPAHLLAVLTAENPTLAAEAYNQGRTILAKFSATPSCIERYPGFSAFLVDCEWLCLPVTSVRTLKWVAVYGQKCAPSSHPIVEFEVLWSLGRSIRNIAMMDEPLTPSTPPYSILLGSQVVNFGQARW